MKCANQFHNQTAEGKVLFSYLHLGITSSSIDCQYYCLPSIAIDETNRAYGNEKVEL